MFPIGSAFVSLGFNAADGHPQGLRTPVGYMVKVKGWSLPKPRSTGPPFQTKSSVVAVMEQVGVLLELDGANVFRVRACLLYTSPSPRDQRGSRMPSSA